MTKSNLIEFKNLDVEFRTKDRTLHALSNIHFAVDEGEFIVIVGRSGCGKSTLLRVLSGLVPPTGGEALVDGRPITGPHHSRGFIFQEPNLYPWQTIFEAVQFGPRARGIPQAERERTAEEMLRMVQLWEFRDDPPYQLSGGMQQRAAIARVLANDPEILLMDEPLGALDALTRDIMQEELRRIWRMTGKTVIFITHSVEEALYLGTRLMVMSPRPGRILRDIPLNFHDDAADEADPRAVRKRADFVDMREEVLEAILAQEESAAV